MKHTFKKGFTLIELMVVIATIAILAAVILSSLSSAKSRGSDAAIKRDLGTIRTQANIYYTGGGSNSYGTNTAACNAGMFSADTIIATSITHATANSGGIACNVDVSTQKFAVAVTLKQTNAGYYCVDSNNVGRVISAASASSGLVGAGSTYALDTNTGLCI